MISGLANLEDGEMVAIASNGSPNGEQAQLMFYDKSHTNQRYACFYEDHRTRQPLFGREIEKRNIKKHIPLISDNFQVYTLEDMPNEDGETVRETFEKLQNGAEYLQTGIKNPQRGTPFLAELKLGDTIARVGLFFWELFSTDWTSSRDRIVGSYVFGPLDTDCRKFQEPRPIPLQFIRSVQPKRIKTL
ncbi:MAG: hypothetical protein NT076_02620 [Candidatus Pacearchaeota archaeon]|nr:hypothetical protein [Candidatus Pacearchaeota archaeon]